MITFSRGADGAYIRSGEIQTRKCRIDIDGRPGRAVYTTKAAISLIEAAISKDQVRAQTYQIMPVESTLDPATVERLAELKRRKVEERAER